MTSLDYLLIASLCTVLLILPLMRFRSMGWVATLFYLIQLFILVSMKELGSDGAIIESGYRLTVLGHSMSWRFDALSWLLGLITIGAAFFYQLVCIRELGRKIYVARWQHRSTAPGSWLECVFHVALVIQWRLSQPVHWLGTGELEQFSFDGICRWRSLQGCT